MPRLLYTAGPGDAFAAFRAWLEGRDDQALTHVGYSSQVFDACVSHGYKALVTSSCPGQADISGRGISVVYRADPTLGRSGLSYHRNLFRKAQQNIRDATDFGADLVVISEDSNPHHYAPMLRKGVKVVQVLHTRLWPEGHRLSLLQRLRQRDFARSYRDELFAIISTSAAITRQVHRIAGPACRPVVEFQPLYRAAYYSDMAAPDWHAPVLDVAFVGRIEANKGALDLVRIAQILAQRGVALRFNICGRGGAMAQMQQMVAGAGLADHFTFHGWCNREKLKQVLAVCQLGIVPTRHDFIEGFNQVAVETILAGRPVVVSDICPVVDYIGDSAVVVPVDDLESYARALQSLAQDRDELMRRALACAADSRRFLDEQYSLGTAIGDILLGIRQGRARVARHLPLAGQHPIP